MSSWRGLLRELRALSFEALLLLFALAYFWTTRVDEVRNKRSDPESIPWIRCKARRRNSRVVQGAPDSISWDGLLQLGPLLGIGMCKDADDV